MNKKWKWIGIIFILAGLLTACSSASTPKNTIADTVKITLKTNPITPIVGKTELILEIQDENGQNFSGAKVEVSADHTDMSGMTMNGLATEQEIGKYVITADFSMSGSWKITVSVQKDSLDYKKDFELRIP